MYSTMTSFRADTDAGSTAVGMADHSAATPAKKRRTPASSVIAASGGSQARRQGYRTIPNCSRIASAT
jgi:hypothetical protein